MGLSENVNPPNSQYNHIINSEHADKPFDLGLPHFQTEAIYHTPRYPKKKTDAGHWTHDARRPNWERTFILLGELNSYSANDNISQTKWTTMFDDVLNTKHHVWEGSCQVVIICR